MRRILTTIVVWVAFMATLAPAVAFAQSYDLSFTLPTAGKSGCMVCHADPNLLRIQGSKVISYWVDGKVLDESAHASIFCTGCHLDFAFKAPHENAGTDEWRRTARLACKNCHKEQWDAYSLGVHSTAVQPGETIAEKDQDKPLCGDCHGSHAIKPLTDNPAGKAELHDRGQEICGRCHEDYWASYTDYYHGAAYRRGANDAPACWQCHGYHDILPSDDRRSPVAENNLSNTCEQCHNGANEEYVSYAVIIHRRLEAYAANPVYSFLRDTQQSIKDIFGTIRSWLT